MRIAEDKRKKKAVRRTKTRKERRTAPQTIHKIPHWLAKSLQPFKL